MLIGIALGRLEAQCEANLYFTSTWKPTNKQLLLCSPYIIILPYCGLITWVLTQLVPQDENAFTLMHIVFAYGSGTVNAVPYPREGIPTVKAKGGKNGKRIQRNSIQKSA